MERPTVFHRRERPETDTTREPTVAPGVAGPRSGACGLGQPASATRRIRLLALVDAGFVPAHARREGPGYSVATGDLRWFQDNIPCQRACPAETDVARYVALIADGRHDDAYAVNWDDNLFPGCLGQVCARPCEDACRRKYVDAPVGIRTLKRVAAERRQRRPDVRRPASSGRRIAIIGAGVAGLSAARDLALRGYHVAIYERYPVPGGMLWAGVPEWRLPRATIAEEVAAITDLGVVVHYGVEIGRDFLLSELADRHDAVIVATGCPESVALEIPGEELDGVIGGLRFLEAVNLRPASITLHGQRVVTIGGGFTSIDCVRSALRLGVTQSTLVYRRSRAEIPVEAEELDEAAREGVDYHFVATPVRILGQQGRVIGVALVRNELSAPDDSGRRRANPVPGSEFVIPCERVIVAIGQRASAAFDPEGLLHRDEGRPQISPTADLRTSHPKIWMAGDAAAKPRNFISAIADGKRVAELIDVTLQGAQPTPNVAELTPLPIQGPRTPLRKGVEGIAGWSLTTPSRRLRWGDDYLTTPRPTPHLRPLTERGLDGTPAPDVVELGLSADAAFAGASRCLQCQLHIFIDPSSCILCNACVEVCPQHSIEMIVPERIDTIDGEGDLAATLTEGFLGRGAAMVIDEEACIRCGRCVDRCPTGSLSLEHFRPVPITAGHSG